MISVRALVVKALSHAPTAEGLSWGPWQDAGPQDPQSMDGQLTLTVRGKAVTYAVTVKPVLYSSSLPGLASRLGARGAGHRLLIASRATTDQANALRSIGAQFLDAEGNAYIVHHGLHFFITGKGAARKLTRTNTELLFHRNALRLIFILLADPNLDRKPAKALLNASFRDLAGAAGISLGSIGGLLRELRAEGFLVDADDHTRRLFDRRKLMERWVAGYAERLRPKLVQARYRAPRFDWWRKVKLEGAHAFWGGEVAAAKLTGYLIPEEATIYAASLPPTFIIRSDLRLDDQGKVELMAPFWGQWPHAVAGKCVHPLIVYADLIATDIDRNLDTAKRVYDQYLRSIAEPPR